MALAIPAAATFFDLKKGVSMGDGFGLSGGLQIMRRAVSYDGTYWGTARSDYWETARPDLWETARNTEIP